MNLCSIQLQGDNVLRFQKDFQRAQVQVQKLGLINRANQKYNLQKIFAQEQASKPQLKAPSRPQQQPKQAQPEPESKYEQAVTVQFQRKMAKEMLQYFRDQNALQIINNERTFGWTKKNELNNGRWVMIGFSVGLLTEYATNVNFIDQLKLMVSYLGLVDLD